MKNSQIRPCRAGARSGSQRLTGAFNMKMMGQLMRISGKKSDKLALYSFPEVLHEIENETIHPTMNSVKLEYKSMIRSTFKGISEKKQVLRR